jgi:hypothetical protein
MSTHVSRSDSARTGRRRSRRARRDRNPRDDHGPEYHADDDGYGDRATDTAPRRYADDGPDDGYADDRYADDGGYDDGGYDGEDRDGGDPYDDDRYDGDPDDAAEGDDEAAVGALRRRGRGARRAGRSRSGGSRGRGRAADPARRGRRGVKPGGGVDPLSKFSASALRRVTVLGDRPSQVVYTLAEQSRRKRGTAVLGTLLGLCGTALVALLGVLVYQLVLVPGGVAGNGAGAIVEPPEGHSTLIPELYQGETENNEVFAPISERPADAEPMAQEQVFGPAEKLELGETQLLLADSETTDTCTAMVWGDGVAQALADNGCTSAARGVYHDPEKEYVAQFTLFDLADAEAAGSVAAALDPTDPTSAPGFLLPMEDGVEGLHTGYSQATSQVMGHYLAVYWVARSDGGAPGDDETMATLNVVAMNASRWVYQQVGAAQEEQEK